MVAGGANFLLFVLLVGFVAFPLGSTIAILMMWRRAKLSDRIAWGIASVLLPCSLILLALALGYLEAIRNNTIMGLAVMSLYAVAFFSPFILLELFIRRFPLKSLEPHSHGKTN